MRKSLLYGVATAALLALTAPANALLTISFQSGASTFSCSDGAGCDLSPSGSNLITLDTTVNGFHISGTLSESNSGHLSMSSFGIQNNNALGSSGTLQILVGDIGFAVPVSQITSGAALVFHNNVGAGTSTMQFFAGPANGQPTFAAPGNLLTTAFGTPTQIDDAFSGSHVDAFSSGSPFAMAELATFNMIGGSSITGFEQSMTTSVPEASTWAMMLLGFAGVGLTALRRRRGMSNFRLA